MSSSEGPSEAMWVAVVLGTILLIVFAGWGVRACVAAQDATLGAAEQEVQRRNFEHSQAYREGLRRDFDELMLAYAQAKSDEERAVVLSVLRHRADGAPPAAVPEGGRMFLSVHPKGT
jgi:hypothetical protein